MIMMNDKKFFVMVAGFVAFLLSGLALVALEDIPIPADFYDGGRAKSQADAIESAIVAQVDTNASTTVTLFTPRRVGDILIGGAGTGTNGVWISKGGTTNDWVQVAP